MRRASVLVTIFALATVAHAAKLRPFVGAGFHLNSQASAYTSCGNNQPLCQDLPDHAGSALQVEAGVTDGIYSGYVGYRSGSASYDAGDKYAIAPGPYSSELILKTSELTATHVVIGGRIEPIIEFMPTWLTPLIGVGVTYGHVEQGTAWELKTVTQISPTVQDTTLRRNDNLASKDAYGGLLQIGLSAHPQKLPVRVYACFEMHSYLARLSGQRIIDRQIASPSAPQYEIREMGVKVGLTLPLKVFSNE